MAIADKAFVRAREVGCGKAEQNNRRTGYEWELQKHSVGFSVHCLSPPCGCGEWKELFRYLSNIRMSCIELFASWKQVSQTCLLISFSFSCHILWKTSFFVQEFNLLEQSQCYSQYVPFIRGVVALILLQKTLALVHLQWLVWWIEDGSAIRHLA